MSKIELLITKYARDMMVERGIDEEQIKRAIKRGSKVRQTNGYLVSYTYLKIAYKKIGKNTYKIKTVMIE